MYTAPSMGAGLPRHRSIWGRKKSNVSSGFRIMFRLELPDIDILSATTLPSVNAPAPEPPPMVRPVVLVPQVGPLPEGQYMKPESKNCPPPPQLGFAPLDRLGKSARPAVYPSDE